MATLSTPRHLLARTTSVRAARMYAQSALVQQRVRITTVLTCPNPECMRDIAATTIRSGEAWMSCSCGVRGGVRRQSWLNITLRPGATGEDLACIVGADEARAMLGAVLGGWLKPEAFERMLALPLSSDRTVPVHVQVVARPRDEHHLRYAPIGYVVRCLRSVAGSN